MRFSRIAVLLYIFGAATGLCSFVFGQQSKGAAAPADDTQAAWKNEVTGRVLAVKESRLQLETREKRVVEVDATSAIKSHRVNALGVGSFITVTGAYDAKGVLHGQAIQRAKKSVAAWAADR